MTQRKKLVLLISKCQISDDLVSCMKSCELYPSNYRMPLSFELESYMNCDRLEGAVLEAVWITGVKSCCAASIKRFFSWPKANIGYGGGNRKISEWILKTLR